MEIIIESQITDKHITLFKQYYHMENFKKAEHILYELLSNEPKNGMYNYYLACCFYNQDKYEEAIEVIQMLIHTDRTYLIRGLELLAKIYYYQCKYQEAEPVIIDLIKEAPTFAEAYGLYAILKCELEAFDEAERLMKKALVLDPNNEEVLYDYYMYCYYCGLEDQMKEVISQYLQLASQENKEKLSNHTFIEKKEDHYITKNLYRQIYLKDPTDHNILKNLRRAEMKRQNIKRCIKIVGACVLIILLSPIIIAFNTIIGNIKLLIAFIIATVMNLRIY